MYSTYIIYRCVCLNFPNNLIQYQNMVNIVGMSTQISVIFPNPPFFPPNLFDAKENMFPVEVASMGVGFRYSVGEGDRTSSWSGKPIRSKCTMHRFLMYYGCFTSVLFLNESYDSTSMTVI